MNKPVTLWRISAATALALALAGCSGRDISGMEQQAAAEAAAMRAEAAADRAEKALAKLNAAQPVVIEEEEDPAPDELAEAIAEDDPDPSQTDQPQNNPVG